MKPTIYDLAKELKLAPSTVSKALRNKPGISKKTRQKVLDYAKEVRYFPNEFASKLKTKSTYTIGVVYSDDLDIGLEHSFFSSILQSFKTYVEKRGYEITFVINNLGQTEMNYVDFCNHKGIEGVFILSVSQGNPDVQELLDSNIYCVATDHYFEKAATIISDNYQGARKATNYLITDDNKVGIISGPLTSISSVERLEGFKDAMEQNNKELDEEFIIEAKHYDFDNGYWAGRVFLEKENRPNSVFVAADLIAMGFIRCLQENGVRVPEDVEVISFDDIPFAHLFTPSLTTIKQDKEMIGKIAAIRLLDMIEHNEHRNYVKELVPIDLIIRDSTRKR